MPQWVRVEFYGLVPDRQVIVGLDPLEVGANLMRVFGFSHIDGLTVVACSEQASASRPQVPPGQAGPANGHGTLQPGWLQPDDDPGGG